MNSKPEAKEGDLRVWWIRNFPSPATRIRVESVDAAIVELERLAERDLTDSEVESNAGGLEVYESGEWVTWYNEDGYDIDEVIDAQEGAGDE